jgi:uncharacterized protein YecE (DUF72 family)
VARQFIGAGGWGYFSGGLRAYAKAFSFVEVNATFYRRIGEATARGWRTAVPAKFTFAVKAHRDITHRARLRPTPAARASLAHTCRVARILRAPFLILETPASLPLGRDELEGLREMASIVEPTTRLAMEARAYAEGPLPLAVKRTMEDLNILDVVDLSRTQPRVSGTALYTRLFGKGEHNVYEFDDRELQSIDRLGRQAETAAFAFHGVRMYKDAARFLTFRRTGAFPPATQSVGLASLVEVLEPDARFPSTREGLLHDHGWKVVDLANGTRAHAAEVLSTLPAGTYEDLTSVIAALDAGSSAGNR